MSQKKNPHKGTPHTKKTTTATKTTAAQKSFWTNRYFLLALILLITFLVFLPTLSNDFINSWDDGVYVTDNTSIINLTWNNIKYYFTTSKNGTYVPLPLLSFAIEYQFFGLKPFPYHLNNLLLHLMCTGLVFRLLQLLRMPILYAALGALFFGIHPMRVETVAWVTERKDLLYSVFYLSAMITYIQYILSEKSKNKYFVLTLILFVLSLFSKIQAVALPLILLLIDYYLERRIQWKLLLEKVPFFVLSLGFGIFGILVLKKTGSFEVNEVFTLPERILFGIYSLCAYIIKFFAPLHLSAFYPYPIKSGQTLPALYYAAPAFLLLLAVLVYLTAKKTRAVVFGSLFFLFNVMFLLQILGAGQAFQADRFTYISYIGLFFLVGWAIQRAAQLGTSVPWIGWAACVVFGIFFCAQAYDRCKDWKDSLTLWTDVIEKFPGKVPSAYANRAPQYRLEQKTDLALADYNYAIALDPTNGISRMNRGNIYFDLGYDSLAVSDYYAAMSINMDKDKDVTQIHKLYCNLGSIYGRRGVYDSALYYLNKSISIDSNFVDAQLNLGLTYFQMGEWEKTIDIYKRGLRLTPKDDHLYSDIGVSYQNLSQFPESIKWFDQAISLAPTNGVYYLNRSYSYNAMNNLGKAREDAVKARDLGQALSPSYTQRLQL